MSLIVIDTSVWARIRSPEIAAAVAEAIAANAVAMTEPLLLELLRSARDENELLALRDEYGALHQISLSAEIAARALDIQAALARRGHHRAASPVDLMVAAAAESVGAEIWHCDRDYELIVEVTKQPSRRFTATG
jgi:predicted nucleic acid-binding protein